MVTTKAALEKASENISESMGVRQIRTHPQFSPRPAARDVGRKPLRNFATVQIDRIVADPDQPRTDFDDEGIKSLAASLSKGVGQLQPIRVRWRDDLDRWMIVSGERRYRAARLAGLTELECCFEDDELTESERLERQLVENLLRDDLKPLEEARGYATLMDLQGLNGKQVAEKLKVSQSRVSRALALLDLPEDVRDRVESGEIPRTAAYELSKLGNADTQRDLAALAAGGNLTQRETSSAVRQRKGTPRRSRDTLRLSFLAENKIRVSVSSKTKQSYHEVKEALVHALDDVQLRIDNNVHL